MQEGQRGHWRALVGLITPNARAVAGMGLLLTLSGVLPLIGPILVAAFIDAAVDGSGTGRLTVLAGVYVGLAVLGQVLAVVVAWAATDLAWRVTNDLRSQLTSHVLGLDLAFHRATSPGELVSRVDGDVTALSDFIARFLVKAIVAMVTLVGLIAVLTAEDWRVGLSFAAYLAVAVLVVYSLRDFAVDEAAGEQAANGRMYGEIEERLAGADDLRSNGGGSHALATFQAASARVLRAALLRERQGRRPLDHLQLRVRRRRDGGPHPRRRPAPPGRDLPRNGLPDLPVHPDHAAAARAVGRRDRAGAAGGGGHDPDSRPAPGAVVAVR